MWYCADRRINSLMKAGLAFRVLRTIWFTTSSGTRAMVFAIVALVALVLPTASGRTASSPTSLGLSPRVLNAHAFGVSRRAADLPASEPASSNQSSGAPARLLPESNQTTSPGDAFDGASGAFADSFAAGALLVMLTDSMIPDSFEQGGKESGLFLTLGFAVALALTVAQL